MKTIGLLYHYRNRQVRRVSWGDKEFALKVLFVKSKDEAEAAEPEAWILEEFPSEGLLEGAGHFTSAHGDGFCVYFVLEYAEGGSLVSFLSDVQATDRINKGRQKYQKVIAKFMVEILTGLTELHDRGLVHRDVKLQNIMLRGKPSVEQNAMLGDFGLICCGKAPCRGPEPNKREFKATCEVTLAPYGTLDYISPWQCKPWRHAGERKNPWVTTPRDDLWATGLVLYQLLLGRARTVTYEQESWLDKAAKDKIDPTNSQGLTTAMQIRMSDMNFDDNSVSFISKQDKQKLGIDEDSSANKLANQLLHYLQHPGNSKDALNLAKSWDASLPKER